MRDSQVLAGNLSCGYTDTDYLLAAQAVAAEVVTGFSSIDGIDLDEELCTPNEQRGDSVLRNMMIQAKRTAVDFLVPLGLEEHLRRSPDGASAYQFWRILAGGKISAQGTLNSKPAESRRLVRSKTWAVPMASLITRHC